ncbi:TPA: hypothetical protein J2F85_003421 [Escherichia coli]|nr:hypothetical protein [Escherichia coli]
MSRFEIVQAGDRSRNKAAIMIERRLFGIVKVVWLKIYSNHPDFDKWNNTSRRDCYGYATMTMRHIEAAYLSLLSEV